MTRFALMRPVTVAMVFAGACLLGTFSWQRLPVQLLPDLVFPQVFVGGGIPSATPEEVERQLAIPVEGELSTLDGVRDIVTQVNPGFFSTSITFDHGTDMKFAVLRLQQKMTALQATLPVQSSIRVNRLDTSDLSSFLMQLSIRGDREISSLREIAERRIKPRLEQVDGIVNVQVQGGRQNNVGVVIDAARCEAHGIPVPQVRARLNAFHRQPEHLGRVIASGSELDVSLAGRVDDLQAIQNLVIDPSGPIRLKDVAAVGYTQEERTRIFRINGKASVGLFVQKDNTSNMLAVADAAQVQIDALNAELTREGMEVVINFSQAELIADAINRVKSLAVTGGLLALAVLFLFLRNLRYVAILMLAIPVSLLATANFMFGFDLSVNIVSLCGLALAIGMLVDNSIVVLENIFSHYQRGKPINKATLDGTREVSRSIFAATMTTILVFLPVLFVESDAQLFVRELALAVIFPLAVSLVVALTVIPLLARLTLRDRATAFARFDSGRTVEIYRLLLKSAIRHRVRTASAVTAMLLIAIFFGFVFILQQAPPPPPDRLELFLSFDRGTTLDLADHLTKSIEDQVGDTEDLAEMRANIRAEDATLALEFKDLDERSDEFDLNRLRDRIENRSERVRGLSLSFDRPQQPGSGRGGGGGDPGGFLTPEIGLRLKGQDLAHLRSLSSQIENTLRSIPEINPRSVRTEMRPGAPELQIHGDRLRMAMWGLTMQEVMRSIAATAGNGLQTSTPFYEGGYDRPIQMQMLGATERQLDDVEETRIANSSGQLIPLRAVADIRLDEGPGNIIRHNQERQVKLTYTYTREVESSKSRLEAAEAQIDRLVREMRLPKGFTLEKLDEDDDRQVYYWMIAIGALLIFMFLASQFESLYSPLVILGTIPTALIGALFALTLTGTPLGMGQGAPMALLGMIVLLGIVVNNGIILLDRIAILRTRHNYRWQRAVVTAAQNRVRPILMTSATTILGVFPLALKQGTEFELWPPFAITILGGLSVSAVATLVFIPVLYVGLEQTKQWLMRIGWPGLIVGSLITAVLAYTYYQRDESILYTSLLVLPLWFSLLAVIYAGQQYIFTRREQKKLATRDSSILIRISNLTKIYGAPGRFRREWQRADRRKEREEGGPEGAQTPKKPIEASIWLGAAGILLGYLHTFIDNGFWLLVLTSVTVVWAQRAWPVAQAWLPRRSKPAAKKKRRWKIRLWKRKSKQNEPVAAEPAKAVPVLRGRTLLLYAAVAYQHLRIQLVPVTVVLLVLVTIFVLLSRTARRIEAGVIKPDLPTGRFRRIKRLYYRVVLALPGIRPPQEQVVALHGVDLEIGRGMFGLLGPNGAGKTTLMRSIVGVLEPDRGSIKINGRNLDEHRDLFHGAIGYLPQDFGLYENMTPEAYLNYHALLNGHYEPEARERLIGQLLESVGLAERQGDKVKTFSGGMKQRVGIAQTLLNLPQIIVVDEPTAGLDPRERIRFRNLLSELSKQRIVIFSTHIVEDISSTCNDLAVLDGGKVIYRGPPDAMLLLAKDRVFETRVPAADFGLWRSRLNIVQHSQAGDEIRIRYLADGPAPDLDSEQSEPTLEDAYVLLLQRESRAGEAEEAAVVHTDEAGEAKA